MTLSRQTLAAIRFGYGFEAAGAAPSGPDALMAQLKRPDPYLAKPRVATLPERLDWVQMNRDAGRARKDGAADAEALTKAANARRGEISVTDLRWYYNTPLTSSESFRERLIAFWSDHFTVEAKTPRLGMAIADMVQTAIRPHVTGRFADMLIAVTTHPAMLAYLDQAQSFGPGSIAGLRRKRGLNENLAREILELHTLGVDGSYTQADVRQFAELLTGMTVDREGFRFLPNRAEPGAETVLGTTYGTNGKAQLAHVFAALEDLARRPDTARHLARKLVVHFVGEPADEHHVASVAEAYAASDGDLTETIRALVTHDAAWVPELRKARTPFEFQIAVLRALGIDRRTVLRLSRKDINRGLLAPAAAMGQQMFRPGGPDGWPEEPEFWITPATLSARIRWAHDAAEKLGADRDPRDVLKVCLRDAAPARLIRAVAGAETRTEGLALIFASPEFNRR